jgi:fatty-acyl-CoA synthase
VLRRRARERLGPVIAHTYGASEMGIVAALSPAEHDRPSRFRCAGHVVPGVDVRFRRADGGLDPIGGSIEVRSPAMAQGYRHRDAEESERFVDGWYRTGDVGGLDAEGMLRIDGRAVDIAAAGAPPVDLQDTLCRLPAVRYAVVVTDPDRGVALGAVEPWPGGAVDLDECAAALSVEHGVTLPIVAFAAIPRTEQGKPDRAAIGAACAPARA